MATGRSPRPGVLLDVDGTLADTNYLHTLSWSRALHDSGEWAPMNAIHRLIGMGGDRLVVELLGHRCPAADEARASRYRELMGEVHLFPGATDLLRALHGSGLAVVLATSSPADELQPVLDALDVADALDACTTADDVAAAKPAPDVFLAAMEAGGVDPRRALAVGDSVWDVQAASAAGIGCVAVETGGSSRHELAEAGALAVFHDVGELLARLAVSPIGQLVDGRR